MKKSILTIRTFIVLILSAFFVKAQTDATLFTYGNEKVNKSEFEQVYNKNNTGKPASYSEQSVREYLDLYINFKLKVAEAKIMGLDTSASIMNEMNTYRKQLSKSYLIDKEVTEQLLKEAYERMKNEVRAKHILIRVSPDASPEDTLKAYKKIMEIKKRVVKEDFSAVAKEVSEDPSAKDNGGDLGYFSAMQMVYPFECAAFTTPAGTVSNPVRTRFGYHLVKVEEVRNSKGQILVQHILIKTMKNASSDDIAKAKVKADEVYLTLKNGQSFEEVAATYSDDKTTSGNGGKLPWFGTNRMVPEFENAAFDLKNNGDYSMPFRTDYGWHIVKRIDKKEIGTFAELKDELKGKVEKDSRAELSKTHFLDRVKKEYNFKEMADAKKELWGKADSSLMKKMWKAELVSNLTKILFTLGQKTVTQKDFADYVEKNQRRANGSSQMMMNKLYDDFVTQTCMDYEESRLETKYPEFRNLMNEYRDGILLFELTDKKVWSKAVQDTSGLKIFFEQNQPKYKWNDRLKATIYKCKNAEVAKKLRAEFEKKNATQESVMKIIDKDSVLKAGFTSEEGIYERGQNTIIDQILWKMGLSSNKEDENGSITFVRVTALVEPQNKTLEEAKGYAVADYQEFLEKNWLAELRKKYHPKTEEAVLKSMIK